MSFNLNESSIVLRIGGVSPKFSNFNFLPLLYKKLNKIINNLHENKKKKFIKNIYKYN